MILTDRDKEIIEQHIDRNELLPAKYKLAFFESVPKEELIWKEKSSELTNVLQHRSKYRINKLGEVFTPRECIEGMLKLLSQEQKDLLSNENITIFEPCCGHGNIVIHVLKKRLNAIYEKSIKNKVKNNEYYAVANSINTLWAIDIDKKNINECRKRIILCILEFLKEKLNFINIKSVICNDKEFIAHIICAIAWQVRQNETLSAMSDPTNAYINGAKTELGEKWVKNNKHIPLDFDNTWIEYYKRTKKNKKTIREFNSALNQINKLQTKNTDMNIIFDFVGSICVMDEY